MTVETSKYFGTWVVKGEERGRGGVGRVRECFLPLTS